MTRTILLSACAFFTFGRAFSQPIKTIPFEFTSEEDNRLIKENDSLKYYVATGDTTKVVSINEDASVYKLFNKEHKLLAEGSYVAEGDKYEQDGKWMEHYSSGGIKIAGYYRRSKPVGTWEEYYSNGKLKAICNYAIFSDESGEISTCVSGSYQEYYQGGKLKLNGYYAASMLKTTDTETIVDPVTENTVYKLLIRSTLKSVKTGHWEYFTEDGELDKKEDF